MQNPEFVFGISGFFVTLVVTWFALWYAFGRHKDGRNQQRYRIWSNAAFAVIMSAFWPIAFGWSHTILLVIVGMVFMLGVALLTQLQTSTCPACKELLRNPEWPAPLAHCYKCGEKLAPPQAEQAVGAGPPQS